MQDQDAPPVEEGETGGGGAVVREADINQTVVTRIAASIPRRWITATALHWRAATTARARGAPDLALPRVMRRPIPSHYRYARTQPLEFSALSTTFSSKLRSRKPPAS